MNKDLQFESLRATEREMGIVYELEFDGYEAGGWKRKTDSINQPMNIDPDGHQEDWLEVECYEDYMMDLAADAAYDEWLMDQQIDGLENELKQEQSIEEIEKEIKEFLATLKY